MNTSIKLKDKITAVFKVKSNQRKEDFQISSINNSRNILIQYSMYNEFIIQNNNYHCNDCNNEINNTIINQEDNEIEIITNSITEEN